MRPRAVAVRGPPIRFLGLLAYARGRPGPAVRVRGADTCLPGGLRRGALAYGGAELWRPRPVGGVEPSPVADRRLRTGDRVRAQAARSSCPLERPLPERVLARSLERGAGAVPVVGGRLRLPRADLRRRAVPGCLPGRVRKHAPPDRRARVPGSPVATAGRT